MRGARCLLVVALMGLAAPARAAEPDPAAPERVDVVLEIDVPIVVTAAALAIIPHLLREELVGFRCAPDCDRSAINALDALALGHRNRGAAAASDALVGLTFATPLVLGLVDVLVTDGG